MKVVVEELEGPEAGRRREFEGPCEVAIGRGVGDGPRDLRVGSGDLTVSRLHCVLEVGLGECRIRDAGSMNGTFVSRSGRFERKVSGTRALRKGDYIRAGTVILCLHPPEAEVRVPATGRRGREAPPVRDRHCAACGAPLCPLPEASPGRRVPPPGPECLFLCPDCAFAEAGPRRAGAGADRRELGEWLLLGRLGQGAMGVVYRAWSARDFRIAAVKEVASSRRNSARTLRLFLREMDAMRDIDHANVVRLLDRGRDEGGHWFASEYLPGGDLDGLAARLGGRIPAPEAARLARDALLGLAAVHAAGFVHRDVKPSNILLGAGPDPVAKIADFGLAKRFLESGESGITRTGEALGTALYMAPEQIRDYRGAGPRADVYSMGVTLFRMVAGRFPFGPEPGLAAGRMDEYIASALEAPPLELGLLVEGLPAGLSEAVGRALAKRPDARWKGAAAFAQELSRVIRAAGGEVGREGTG